MKSERLFAIMNWLLDKRRATAPELATRFSVSTRTIYRDLDSLAANGVPLRTAQGYQGGFELAEGFTIDRSFLSQPELADLVGALRGFDEALKAPALASSLGKLAGLGAGRQPPPDAGHRTGGLLRRPTDRTSATGGSADQPPGRPRPFELPPPLSVSLTPWGGPSPDAATVELFRRAIAERRTVELAYRTLRGDASRRVVEPFTIALGGPVWYVHAWCRLRQKFRIFRLSRVESAELGQERYDPRAHGPVPPPFASAPTERLVAITLEAAADARTLLTESFGAATITTLPESRIQACFEYPEGDWLVGLLLSLGGGLRVVEPASLRASLHQAARRVAERNR
ncbi:MAG: hypothetical protein A2087_03920 [Spirochaetes bacterium GWD1_61_31]|nr:MAG: hypothetical protein A2Y37_05040 [Spirochaetes bacterium GWB1_60_80]OHD42722.1 MAG: hypothetical protein A2087_03920 [Spirochaetes bacterium GWD1_61_31]OHD43739.1 MAG: hypothetical protein A2Y35_00230 [Spirochaetes bacterium GWE1_60_18]OHD60225.1 MAG: hypothetical protein A2Y32_07280 [Spirochaetes bacterium GWF1_60_12]HAP44373.1 hypothetical protein [Spirochaetaceae bacterium]